MTYRQIKRREARKAMVATVFLYAVTACFAAVSVAALVMIHGA